jgi:predicted ATPase/DNA-binding SARP family transcriptional activator
VLRFRVLGPVQLLADREPISLGGPKQRVLLAYLLLARSRFVPRAELIDAIWGEAPPASAVASLHVYVHGLRRVLGSDRIETRGLTYRVRLEPEELDLERFELMIEHARRSLKDGMPERAAAVLREALGLWAGPALGDLPSDAFRAEREHLEELRLSALELLLDADLARGQHEAVIAAVGALVAEQPYRERLREQQILALYRAGRQKDALDAYREARRVLIDELGIEPGPGLRGLEAAVLRQEPDLAAPAPNEGRTKVVLPAPPTRLINRRQEMEDVLGLFGDEGARLVTLTGPGGTGKTRLALAVAERLGERLADGARFVDLSAVPGAELLLPTIADQLAVQPGSGSLATALADTLRPLRMLLVLDNLERLLMGATGIADLLSAAPNLLVLATSRAPLRLRAEYEYPVPPLALPEPHPELAAAAESDAVRLLVERGRAVNRSCVLNESSVAPLVRICRRLDGLPLAIELAATRFRTLAPETVAGGLDHALELLVDGPLDLPARQRTLRATLDWSCELLDEQRRAVFARLASFAGTFRSDDVETVAGAGARDSLAGLVEVSLVRELDPDRFRMLETIREYAAESLELRGESQTIRGRHCRHFLALADQAYAAILSGDDSPSAYRALAEQHDNLRAALIWAGEAGEVKLEVRLACALRQFWLVRGHLAEGRTFFERAVADTAGHRDPLRAQALMHGAPFLYRQGELERAEAWWEEALTLLTELGDAAGAARCAGELGSVAFSEGDLERAASLYARSADGFVELDDEMRLAIVSSNLAQVEALRGNLKAAIEYAERSVALNRTRHDPETLAVALHTLGRLRLTLGDLDAARALFAECLVQAREVGYREVIAHCVAAAAELALGEDPHSGGPDPSTAARLWAIARASLTEMAVLLQGTEAQSFALTESRLESQLGRGRLSALVQQATQASLDDAIDEALDILAGSHPGGRELEPR